MEPTTIKTKRIPAIELPIKIGMENGFNACLLTDAGNNTIASLYNIPMHTSVEEVRKLKRDRYALGLEIANDIVRAVNSHAELVATLEEMVYRPTENGRERAISALARAKGQS